MSLVYITGVASFHRSKRFISLYYWRGKKKMNWLYFTKKLHCLFSSPWEMYLSTKVGSSYLDLKTVLSIKWSASADYTRLSHYIQINVTSLVFIGNFIFGYLLFLQFLLFYHLQWVLKMQVYSRVCQYGMTSLLGVVIGGTHQSGCLLEKADWNLYESWFCTCQVTRNHGRGLEKPGFHR